MQCVHSVIFESMALELLRMLTPLSAYFQYFPRGQMFCAARYLWDIQHLANTSNVTSEKKKFILILIFLRNTLCKLFIFLFLISGLFIPSVPDVIKNQPKQFPTENDKISQHSLSPRRPPHFLLALCSWVWRFAWDKVRQLIQQTEWMRTKSDI